MGGQFPPLVSPQPPAMASSSERPTSNDSFVTLPLPDVDDLSDSDESEYASIRDVRLSQPIKAFFLGCRQSQIIDPRKLEEGLYETKASSSSTLVDLSEKALPGRGQPALPTRHPLRTNGPIPSKKGNRAYRYVRWNFGSVYRRIFSLAFLGNIGVLAFLVIRSLAGGPHMTYNTASYAVSANLLAAMLIRNEHVVNVMFAVFGTWPRRLPLPLRHLCAKVYSYGGIHSGCAVAATFWYLAFLILLTREYVSDELTAVRGYVFLASYGIILLLVMILIFAHPRMRVVMHNWFEGVHRFLGWTVVLFFWAQVLLMAADASSGANTAFGMALAVSPVFWMLVCITLLVVYPWSRLRCRDVEAEQLSDHCIKLNFNYRNAHYGQAIKLADSPLRETHAFATIPNPPAPPLEHTHCGGCSCTEHEKEELAKPKGLSNGGKKGFSVVISNAGDWTSKIIKNPPTKMYTRGVPQYGVLRVAGMFEPVIVMATGSGIAPCLSLFVEKPDHPVRIIWSAPSPLETFGQGVMDAVLRADPNAVVIDTRKTGRPDLVSIAYRMWEASKYEGPREFALGRAGKSSTDGKPRKPLGQCQAVVIISNQKVTRKVVYGLESRGVRAYGAIFDS